WQATPLDRHAHDFFVGGDHAVADGHYALHRDLGLRDGGHDIDHVTFTVDVVHRLLVGRPSAVDDRLQAVCEELSEVSLPGPRRRTRECLAAIGYELGGIGISKPRGGKVDRHDLISQEARQPRRMSSVPPSIWRVTVMTLRFAS